MKNWVSVLVMMTAGLASAQVPGFFSSVNATGDYSNSNGTLIPYTSPGLGFGVSQPPVGPGLSMAAWCQAVTCNSYSAFGDSNTQGAHATGVLCLTGNTGTCYPDVISQKLNALGGGINVMGNVTNYGIGGTGLNAANIQIFNDWVEDVGSRRVGTLMMGSNDTAVYGQQGPIVLMPAYSPEWKAEYSAIDQWVSVPFSQKVAAGSGTLSGFTTDSTFASMTGATSSTNGSTVSLPAMTLPAGNSSVVLYYTVSNGNGGTFSWQLINASTSAVYTSGTGICAPSNGQNVYSPTSGYTYAEHTIMLPGYQFGPAGSYYFKVTVTSATSSSNVVTVLGSGYSYPYTAVDWQTASPQFWVFNVPLQGNGIFRNAIAELSADMKSAVYNDQISGFNVNFYDDWNWVHGTFPEYGGAADYIHLSVLGSSELANGAVQSTAMLPTTGISQTYYDPNIVNATRSGAFTTSGSDVDGVGNTIWSYPTPTATNAQILTGETIVISGSLGTSGLPNAGATFRGAGGGGLGRPWLMEDWYYNTSTSTVQNSSWQETNASNQAATVTPTAIVRTWNCAGTCIPYLDNYTYPATSTLGFNGISSFTLKTTTAATSSVNNNGPVMDLFGTYWNGSANANDLWAVTPTLGTGSNPTSTLAFAHTGSSGTANVTMPSLTVSGTSRGGTVTDGTCSMSGGTLTGCSSAGATPRTCNANGCYKIDADGTITQWGVTGAGCGGSAACNSTWTFPIAFTTTSNLSVTVSAGGGGANNFIAGTNGSPTTTGFTIQYLAAAAVGGAGSNLPGTQTASWIAIGH